MGKVIILTGAPAAASLDWTALDAEAVDARDATSAPGWNEGWANVSTDGGAGVGSSPFDHPQWRILPETHGDRAPRTRQPERMVGGQDEGENGDAVLHVPHVPPPSPPPPNRHTNTTTPAATRGWRHGPSQDARLDQHMPSVASIEPSLSVLLPDALPPRRGSPGDGKAAVSSLSSSPPRVMSQTFLEHSRAVHDSLPSSLPDISAFPAADQTGDSGQVAAPAPAIGHRGPNPLKQYVAASFSTLLDEAIADTAHADVPDTAPRLALPTSEMPRWQPRTRLADIPSAAELLRLAPQTVTVHLVVAVVSVGAPRIVSPHKRRRNGSASSTTSLVELVIGDESRTGFAMTVWMDGVGSGGRRGRGSGPEPPPLASLLSTLRPQDVVLLRHVALHVFGDKVYGSSLRKDQTKMHILYRCQPQSPGRPSSSSNGDDVGHRDVDTGDDALFTPAHMAAVACGPQSTDSQSTQNTAAWQLLTTTACVRNWALRHVVVDCAQLDSFL